MLVLVDISYNLHDKSEKTKKKSTKAIFSPKKTLFKSIFIYSKNGKSGSVFQFISQYICANKL